MRDSIGDMPSHDALLLTGATGFVGAAVLARHLERSDRPVVALVRAPDQRAASARLRRVLGELFDPGEADELAARCTAVPADLLAPRLGLDLARRDDIARRVTEVVHCAASVEFDQPLAQARSVNLTGARRVTQLAELCSVSGEGLRRVVHVSTAYVAGERDGVFDEDEHGPPPAFRNTYEQTKHEAEHALRTWPGRLPLQIVRPSIVVGDRRTGWTSAFNVLYWPLRMYARGHLPVVPAVREAPVDVVPVDYVADAVHALADALPGTYHAVAGEHASTVGEVIDLAAGHFGLPAAEVVAPETLDHAPAGPLRPEQQRALDRARVLFPYFRVRVRFDDRRSRDQLRAAGVGAEPLASYFPALMAYAERADWGRRPVSSREAAMAA
jgi:thioester reductase-like protein